MCSLPQCTWRRQNKRSTSRLIRCIFRTSTMRHTKLHIFTNMVHMKRLTYWFTSYSWLWTDEGNKVQIVQTKQNNSILSFIDILESKTSHCGCVPLLTYLHENGKVCLNVGSYRGSWELGFKSNHTKLIGMMKHLFRFLMVLSRFKN